MNKNFLMPRFITPGEVSGYITIWVTQKRGFHIMFYRNIGIRILCISVDWTGITLGPLNINWLRKRDFKHHMKMDCGRYHWFKRADPINFNYWHQHPIKHS